VKNIFFVILLAGLIPEMRAQIASPFRPAGSDSDAVSIQSLWFPLPSASPQGHPPDLFTQTQCLYVDAFDCVARDLAGIDSVDCGRVRLSRDPKYASDCARRAFAHRQPFRVRYDVQGIDTDAARTIVMTLGGRLIEVDWVSDTWLKLAPGYIDLRPCNHPARLKTNSQGELECSPLFRDVLEDRWPKFDKAAKVKVKEEW